jgi:hypothetical protein
MWCDSRSEKQKGRKANCRSLTAKAVRDDSVTATANSDATAAGREVRHYKGNGKTGLQIPHR